jgi:hypothetical protein
VFDSGTKFNWAAICKGAAGAEDSTPQARGKGAVAGGDYPLARVRGYAELPSGARGKAAVAFQASVTLQ